MADVKLYVADGMALCKGDYFNLTSGMLNRTLLRICGRWYLPMLLFKGELLTLMYIDPFIVLVRFWSFLPTILNLNDVKGRSPHLVHNTRDFIQQTKDIKLEEEKCISSYDVKVPFTSVPIESLLKIIKE